jgi:ABC-type transport system substrate-binding protein
MDPLIYYDADLSVWPHLAESYTMLNDTTLQIDTRHGIYWADPFNVFADQEFNVEDVYFTLYAWKYLSNDKQVYDWVEDMEIIDEDTMIIYIDGDPTTPENDPYAPFLPSISLRMLPEHYLNQTQDVQGRPDVAHASWNTFATRCFGTGQFEIDTFTEGVETILTLRDNDAGDRDEYCWRFNTTITSDPALNWEARFGDYSGGLDTLRIRIIPDAQTSLLEFEAGKVDMDGVTAYPDKRDDYLLDPDFEVQSDTQFYFGFFGYNMRPVRPVIGSYAPAVNDPSITKGLAIRKAISYALDRIELNNVIHRGEYIITDHPIYVKQGIWCNPNIIRYNHDLDKAREYMQKAGYLVSATTPGFGFLITLSSLMAVAVASVYIVRRKK